MSFLGGKNSFYQRGQAGGRRNDEMDLISSVCKKGYLYVSNKNELGTRSAARFWDLFSSRT